jgi:hypothetical protein
MLLAVPRGRCSSLCLVVAPGGRGAARKECAEQPAIFRGHLGDAHGVLHSKQLLHHGTSLGFEEIAEKFRQGVKEHWVLIDMCCLQATRQKRKSPRL